MWEQGKNRVYNFIVIEYQTYIANVTKVHNEVKSKFKGMKNVKN